MCLMQFSKLLTQDSFICDFSSNGINAEDCTIFEYEGSNDIQHLKYSLAEI